MRTRSSLILAVTMTLGLGLTACGGDDVAAPPASVSASSTADSSPATQASSTTSAPAASSGTEAGDTPAASRPAAVTETSNDSSTVASTSSNTTRPSASCATMTGKQAAAQSIPRLAAPFPDMPDVTWQVDPLFGVGTYDACAALSYIVVGVQGATASSPEHIMLFHNGAYLGTATKDPQGFVPKIRRLTDRSIAVSYTYPTHGEGNANASGRASATFTWNDAKHRVIMVGSLPPSPAG